MSGHHQASGRLSATPASGGILSVLSGPAGVGKDDLIRTLKAQGFPMHYAVTMTTRPRRPSEVDGVDYHFVTPAVFQELCAAGELLESAEVHGHSYGTPRAQVRAALAAGKNVLLKIDVQGATSVRRLVPEAVLIFLAPPSIEALRERMAQRGTEDADDLARRLRDAAGELAQVASYDYLVVNHTGRLAAAVEQVKAIVVAESCRTVPRRAVL